MFHVFTMQVHKFHKARPPKYSVHFSKDTRSQKIFTSEKLEIEKFVLFDDLFFRHLTNWLIVAAPQPTV